MSQNRGIVWEKKKIFLTFSFKKRPEEAYIWCPNSRKSSLHIFIFTSGYNNRPEHLATISGINEQVLNLERGKKKSINGEYFNKCVFLERTNL